jgi:hypothetical protein
MKELISFPLTRVSMIESHLKSTELVQKEASTIIIAHIFRLSMEARKPQSSIRKILCLNQTKNSLIIIVDSFPWEIQF